MTNYWLIPVILSFFFFSSCSGNSTFYLSVPYDIPESSKGKIYRNILTIEEEGFMLSIEIHNESPLGIWLSFDSQGVLNISPSSVQIIDSNGRIIEPITYLGPSESWSSPRAFHQGCGPRNYSLGMADCRIDLSSEDKAKGNVEKGVQKTSTDKVSFSGKHCFMFWYDFSPSVLSTFQLYIGSLHFNNQLVELPSIEFGIGKITHSLTETKVEPFKGSTDLQTEFYNTVAKSSTGGLPKDIVVHMLRGDDYYELGRFDLAIEDYTKALQLDPKFVDAYINRGHAYSAAERYDLAIYDYNAAIDLEPSSGLAYNNLAWLYVTAKDEQYLDALKALPLALKATDLSANTPAFWDTLATVYNKLGRYKEASEIRSKIENIIKPKGDLTQSRFIDNNDSTVTDTKTGLMWFRVDSNPLSRIEAQYYCDFLEISDYSDWRLPTLSELEELYAAGIRPYDKPGNHIIKIHGAVHNSSLQFGPYDFDIGHNSWEYKNGMDAKWARALAVRDH